MIRYTLQVFAAFAGLLCFSGNIVAQDYQVFDDESSFFNSFDSPIEYIDFTQLKDGTQFSTTALFSPLVRYTSGPPFAVGVSAEAWSNLFDVGTTNPGCGCAWAGVTWYGGRVAPEKVSPYGHVYLSNIEPGAALAAWTSAGFFGLVPLDESSTYYVLPYGADLFAVGFGYSQVSSVPEPASHVLFAAGLVAMGGGRFLRRLAPASAQT